MEEAIDEDDLYILRLPFQKFPLEFEKFKGTLVHMIPAHISGFHAQSQSGAPTGIPFSDMKFDGKEGFKGINFIPNI